MSVTCPYTNAMITGKDYSNARVGDFHNLDKPEEDMYDRTQVPRMAWYVMGSSVAHRILIHEC